LLSTASTWSCSNGSIVGEFPARRTAPLGTLLQTTLFLIVPSIGESVAVRWIGKLMPWTDRSREGPDLNLRLWHEEPQSSLSGVGSGHECADPVCEGSTEHGYAKVPKSVCQ
jgi:hypothetical protein